MKRPAAVREPRVVQGDDFVALPGNVHGKPIGDLPDLGRMSAGTTVVNRLIAPALCQPCTFIPFPAGATTGDLRGTRGRLTSWLE
jgi:hypothetical protein